KPRSWRGFVKYRRRSWQLRLRALGAEGGHLQSAFLHAILHHLAVFEHLSAKGRRGVVEPLLATFLALLGALPGEVAGASKRSRPLPALPRVPAPRSGPAPESAWSAPTRSPWTTWPAGSALFHPGDHLVDLFIECLLLFRHRKLEKPFHFLGHLFLPVAF